MPIKTASERTFNDEFDDAVQEVMREFDSGELYQKQLAAMKKGGIDPDQPLVLEFANGSKTRVNPRKSISHLKP